MSGYALVGCAPVNVAERKVFEAGVGVAQCGTHNATLPGIRGGLHRRETEAGSSVHIRHPHIHARTLAPTPCRPAPGASSLVCVCGPPPMMKAISGDKAQDKSQGPLEGMLKVRCGWEGGYLCGAPGVHASWCSAGGRVGGRVSL